MKCGQCGKPYTAEEIEAKRKQKSDRIKAARKEARENGSFGRIRKVDYEVVQSMRRSGHSIRSIAKYFNCSTSPVVAVIHGSPQRTTK